MESEFIKSISVLNRKISEICAIREYGINLMKRKGADEIIDQIVEEPLRKACKELRRKGIETVMSSANRDNLLKDEEKALEKEDVNGKQYLLDAPTYLYNMEEDKKKSPLDEEFEERSFVLQYNSDIYSHKVVFLRMPINNETTVIDVEKYFEKLISRLKQQQLEINIGIIEDSREV